MIRYADDFVIGVAREDDARRIMEVLPKRMSKYGLTVHPEKTRLVRFQPPQDASSETEERDPPEPRTFDFLGFTHYWGRSQRGVWVVKRKTANGRLSGAERCGMVSKKSTRSGQGTAPEARAKAARPLRVLRDHWQLLQPSGILEGMRRIWRRKLSRRRRDGDVTWAQFLRLEKHYSLPRARVVHGLQSRVAKS